MTAAAASGVRRGRGVLGLIRVAAASGSVAFATIHRGWLRCQSVARLLKKKKKK